MSEKEKLTEEEYAKYTSGKVEGLRIALTAFIRQTQPRESIDSYTDRLYSMEEFIREVTEDEGENEEQDWYANGAIEMLSDFVNYLSESEEQEDE